MVNTKIEEQWLFGLWVLFTKIGCD